MLTSKINGEKNIRSALLNRYLHYHSSRNDTLILCELGLAHARCRVDVAMINGCINGYEIKSARDNLDRLPTQLDIYRKSLQKLTLVVATKHLSSATALAPKWCGILEVLEGPRGGISFRIVQHARINPEVDPFMLAHLLWRGEVHTALIELGAKERTLKGSRKDLYRLLVEEISLKELSELIKRFIVKRQGWRDPALLM